MNIPGYDAWILRGPEEHRNVIMEACDSCKGTGQCSDTDGLFDCEECKGVGDVDVTLDEPDGDYLYELARDNRMDRGVK